MALSFYNAKQLEEKLEAAGISLEAWGKGSSKSLEDLYKEVVSRECSLQVRGEQLCRVIHVACVIITHKEDRLWEYRQFALDGREEPMRLPTRQGSKGTDLVSSVAEKMRWNELARDAAARAVREELDIAGDLVLTPYEPSTSTEVAQTQSYPGLATMYKFYWHDLELSDEQRESVYVEQTEKKLTLWLWFRKGVRPYL